MTTNAHRPANAETIVIGLGSPNGDDQLGWWVVDRLSMMGIDAVAFRKISHPIDLLHVLDGNDHVHLVDAAYGMGRNDLVRRLRVADLQDRQVIDEISAYGTHDFSLSMTLRLAESLGHRMDHVTLWAGQGRSFHPLGDLTDVAKRSVEACVVELNRELCDARNVAC